MVLSQKILGWKPGNVTVALRDVIMLGIVFFIFFLSERIWAKTKRPYKCRNSETPHCPFSILFSAAVFLHSWGTSFDTAPPTGWETNGDSDFVAVRLRGRWRRSAVTELGRCSKVPAAAEIKSQSGGGTQTALSNWTS